MINRQATSGAGAKTATKTATKTTTNAPARAKPARDSGVRTPSVTAKGKKTAPWHGDEVLSPSPLVASSAEEAAARAEGNTPISAVQAARDPDPGTYTEKGPARRPRADAPDVEENVEEKRRSAAEEHATQSSRHFPYGRL